MAGPITRRHLMIRGVALVILLMGAYIVWSRNFGADLKEVPVLAILSGALSFALEGLDRSQSERAKKWLTHSMLSLPFLVAGYIAGFVLLVTTAPVIVLSNSDSPLSATLTAIDTMDNNPESAAASKDAPARFHTLSSPLGRSFKLKVNGYATKVLNVTAPAGATVSIEHDLLPQLVVLIRPTLDGMVELHSGGSIHVYSSRTSGEVEIASAKPNLTSSILLGPSVVPVPHDMIEDWRLELAGMRVEDTVRANTLRAWKTPVRVPFISANEELTPHEKLRVELRNESTQPIQCGATDLPELAGAVVDFPLGVCPKTSSATGQKPKG